MARISQQDIDYILDNTDIVSLVSEYVKLENKGKNYVGLCPFHNEKTPSFSVSPEKKIAHCFGCGGGGNVFGFLSQIDNITYQQAIVKLGNRLGLDLEEQNSKKSFDLNKPIDTMYYANNLVADYYNYILLNTKEAEDALLYLTKRGISKETIKYFNLGYAPKSEQMLVDFLRAREINLDYAQEAGLINQASNGKFFDVFSDRIMFPIKDDNSRVVAFSGRTMSEDKSVAKYYNTHETSIFEKRNTLYNFSDARPYISKENNIILAEGYMDVIRAHQAGVKNVVAIMGTNLDEKKIESVSRLVGKFTLALDNDQAGLDAQIEIGNKLLNQTDKVYKLKITSKKDIDEFIAHKEKDEEFSFKDYVERNTQHFLEWKIQYYKSLSEGIEDRINYKDEVIKNLALMRDESLKDLLLSELASEFEIDKKILVREFSKIKPKNRPARAVDNYYSIDRESVRKFYSGQLYDKRLCKLFKYILGSRELFLVFYEDLEKIEFENKLFDKLLLNLVVYYNNYNTFELHKFLANVDDKELIHLITYIDNTDFLIEDNPTEAIVKDYIDYFKFENNINREFNKLKESLHGAIGEDDNEAKLSILAQLKKYKK